MKPRTPLRFLSLALFALWGRAGAEDLPPFVVPANLLGQEAASAPRHSAAPVSPQAPAAVEAVAGQVAPMLRLPDAPSAITPAPARAANAVTSAKSGKPSAAPAAPKTGETRIVADAVTGLQDVEVNAEGQARLERDGTVVDADRMKYLELTDEVEATGNVVVTRDQDTMRGPRLRMKVGEQVGVFETPEYAISRPARQARAVPGQEAVLLQPVKGHGKADVLNFEGENQYHFQNATWSSCKPEKEDWYITSKEMQLDYDREIGEVSSGTLVFKGVPVMYLPWADFPLANQRTSGLLPPTFGTSNKSGVDLSLPYYWNIAPNYDDTFTTRYIGRRGLQLRNEMRYLTPDYKGRAYVEWLPEDQVLGRSRSAGSWLHEQNFGDGWSGRVNVNGVSDPRYFTDLSNKIQLTSSTNLVREASLGYAGGGWWSVNTLVQAHQTLQDSNGVIATTPYKRLPQVTFNANRPELPGGLQFLMNGEFVQFSHPTQDEGRRMLAYPQLALPIQTSAFYITPKVGLHMTSYDLERRTSTGDDRINRSLPIFSVDSGVTFERETELWGKGYIQTLEPRAYYLYVPYRDQANIPVFDSGTFDFNFAQIFSENIFTGNDRIANANQLTTMVQSKLINPGTGGEVMRAAIGQRFYMADQEVTLPGITPRTGKEADWLAAFSTTLMKDTSFDTAWQYNPRDDRTERFSSTIRYQAGPARMFSAGWRYRRNYATDVKNPDGFRDIDLIAQWPLWNNWYVVGRYNRNLRDHRLTQGIGGVEYNAGCWVFRGVVQQITTSATDVNRSIFFQIEFNGVGSLGSNPLYSLRRNVPGYTKINDGTTALSSDDDD
ncbi:LPS assembly protein LptD [Zoogloea sp.]|uniref:LPS-assembly protein LptD n=1 Tax=Zoogloea sp. TaxID=49181 RepID=UPI0035AE3ECE